MPLLVQVNSLVPRKEPKWLPPTHFLGSKYNKNAFAVPTREAYSAPQTSELDLAATSGEEGKGRIRKMRGKGEVREEEGMREEGDSPQKGGLGLLSLKRGCPQALLAGYTCLQRAHA